MHTRGIYIVEDYLMHYDTWELEGEVVGKALDYIEVEVNVRYDVEPDDTGSFPVIERDATYEDEDGNTQDYRLGEREADNLYDEIYRAIHEPPVYDEYGGAL